MEDNKICSRFIFKRQIGFYSIESSFGTRISEDEFFLNFIRSYEFFCSVYKFLFDIHSDDSSTEFFAFYRGCPAPEKHIEYEISFFRKPLNQLTSNLRHKISMVKIGVFSTLVSLIDYPETIRPDIRESFPVFTFQIEVIKSWHFEVSYSINFAQYTFFQIFANLFSYFYKKVYFVKTISSSSPQKPQI